MRSLDTVRDAENQLTAQRTAVEILHEDSKRELHHQIKQASLNGATMRDIFEAMGAVMKNPGLLKTACKLAAEDLGEELYFREQDQTEKTASGTVNLEHPLVWSYKVFEDLTKKASILKRASEKLAKKRASIETLLHDKLQHAQ